MLVIVLNGFMFDVKNIKTNQRGKLEEECSHEDAHRL